MFAFSLVSLVRLDIILQNKSLSSWYYDLSYLCIFIYIFYLKNTKKLDFKKKSHIEY